MVSLQKARPTTNGLPDRGSATLPPPSWRTHGLTVRESDFRRCLEERRLCGTMRGVVPQADPIGRCTSRPGRTVDARRRFLSSNRTADVRFELSLRWQTARSIRHRSGVTAADGRLRLVAGVERHQHETDLACFCVIHYSIPPSLLILGDGSLHLQVQYVSQKADPSNLRMIIWLEALPSPGASYASQATDILWVAR